MSTAEFSRKELAEQAKKRVEQTRALDEEPSHKRTNGDNAVSPDPGRRWPRSHGKAAHSDDVGRAFRLMSATCSDRSRPAVPIDVGRVAERPLVGGDLCITRCIGSSGDGFRSLLLA
jgi:hypothetical protein